MGFAPKYTQAQRRAIARLMLDENRSGPEVVSMAAAGEIDGERFRIPRNTVYYIAEVERNRRQREQDAEVAKVPGGQAVVTHRKSVEMIERERRRLEREAAKTGKLDVVRMDRLASAQNKLNRGQARLPSQPTSEPKAQPEQPDTLERRLERAEREAPPTPPPRTHDSWPHDWRKRQEVQADPEPAAEEPPTPPAPKQPTVDELLADRSPVGIARCRVALKKQGYDDRDIERMIGIRNPTI